MKMKTAMRNINGKIRHQHGSFIKQFAANEYGGSATVGFVYIGVPRCLVTLRNPEYIINRELHIPYDDLINWCNEKTPA